MADVRPTMASFDRRTSGAGEKRTSRDGAPGLQRQTTILRVPQEEKKQDVFDQEDFEATSFINKLYPDEASLTDLDRFMAALKKQIQSVDQEIFAAVRNQGGAHTRARNDLAVAQGQISELAVRIKEIQAKAEASEALVQEICRDIKKLDYAKKHLTNAITALRRLAMLTAAVADLEAVVGRHDQYRKASNLLEAVHQLMEYFQQYEAIPKIRSLSKRLGVIETTLRESVLDDFKLLMGHAQGADAKESELPPESLDRLAHACLVVNALGPAVRDQVMDWLCEKEMGVYATVFGGTSAMPDTAAGPGSRLERFEARFAWFRKRLEEKKDVYALFPDAWRVPQVLCLTFCKITKASLKRALSDDESQGGLSQDISPLIKAVVATNKFEKDMASMFGGGTLDEEEAEEEAADQLSAAEARRRLEKVRQRNKQEAAAEELAKMAGPSAAAREAQEAVKVAFEGAISEAFEDALRRYYVAEEEKELISHLSTNIQEEHERKWMPPEEDGNTRILASASKLFFKIRSSLTRCVKNVSRGVALVALGGAFKRVLAAYAQELYKRVPKPTSGTTSALPGVVGGSIEWHVRMSDDEQHVLCCVLATAEYCKDTVDALAGALKKDVKPASLAEHVDMGDEESAFFGVTSACMNALVLGVNSKLDLALADMLRAKWDTMEMTGDDSSFVSMVRRVLLDCGPRIGADLDGVNFAFFCDKAARMFVPRLSEAVLRLRRISEKGTLQLAIDIDSIRRILLDFPKVARGDAYSEDDADVGPNSSYAHYVEREMGSVINVVKVLQSKAENLVDTYLLLMPAHAQSLMEFSRICEMKALTRKQQQDLMALYQAKVGGDMGAGAGMASLPSASASSNLGGALKAGVNNFARELTSGLPFGAAARARAGPDSPGHALQAKGSTSFFGKAAPGGGHMRSGSFGEPAAGSAFAAGVKETAAKTKDAFSKVVNAVGILKSLNNPSADSDHGHGH